MTRTDPVPPNTTPCLAPDWRWQRAVAIVARGGHATLKRDGELIRSAVHCARALDSVVTPRGIRGVVRRFPSIYFAMKLSIEATLRPLEVRARALAGQSDRVIGRAVGLPAPTIADFLDLFFDVRPRLGAGTWIRQGIGLVADQVPNIESLMLLHSWRRGPRVIPAWLDFLGHQCEHHDLRTEIGRQRASIQLLVDVQQLPRDAATERSLLRTCHLTLSKRDKTVVSGSAAGVFSRIGDRKLGQIVWKEHANRGEEFQNRARDSRQHDDPRDFGQSTRVA